MRVMMRFSPGNRLQNSVHPRPDEVKMDLVAHHEHVVGKADLADAHKLLFAPYPAGGVVGAAQKYRVTEGSFAFVQNQPNPPHTGRFPTTRRLYTRGAAIFLMASSNGW